jgi:hypothetical protein
VRERDLGQAIHERWPTRVETDAILQRCDAVGRSTGVSEDDAKRTVRRRQIGTQRKRLLSFVTGASVIAARQQGKCEAGMRFGVAAVKRDGFEMIQLNLQM